MHGVNPIALRNAKIVYNVGLSECIWVKLNTVSASLPQGQTMLHHKY